jgi:predicted Zn finger-like uncharacterized protein
MLITCKECEAVYCIADKIIGPLGRMVKCAKCHHVWSVESPHDVHIDNEPLEYCSTLPVLVQKDPSNNSIVIPIFLVLAIIIINFFLFSESLSKFTVFRNIYEQSAIYNSEGLMLQNFSFEIRNEGIFMEGEIFNDSNEDRIIADMRYELLDEDKKVIFRYTYKTPDIILNPGKSWPIKANITKITENAKYLQLDIGNKLELLLRD